MSESRSFVGFGGGDPFEVLAGVKLDMAFRGVGPGAIPAGALGPIEGSWTFEATLEFWAWWSQLLTDPPEVRERRAAAHRRAWSGPGKMERQILRAYKVSARQIGAAPRSAFSSAYRQRQRNRAKRRRR